MDYYIEMASLKADHAVAQMVSRRFPTMAFLLRSLVRLCGICDGQYNTMADYLRVLWFPLSIHISLIAPHFLIIILPSKLYNFVNDSFIK